MDEISKFEQTISAAYLEACIAGTNDVAEGGEHDNRFLLAATAIKQAWPDVIERLAKRL